MRLRELLDPGVVVQGQAGANPDIQALSVDSREVADGTLFAALAGSRLDGRRYIDDAVAKGAVAILGDPSLEERVLPVPLIIDPEPRRRLALMAKRFFKSQPDHIVAVTGTNGKTSVASFTKQLWQITGLKAASLGTLGLDAPGFEKQGSLTTPDPVSLHRLLRDLADGEIRHLALEASSHGLDQHRLDGVSLRAAAFTNLSRDHFDYHGSAEAYFNAKARLFRALLPADGVAVLNADIAEFDRLEAMCRERRIETLSYGRKGRDIRLVDRVAHGNGQDLLLEIRGSRHKVGTALMGGFQAENLMAALALASSCRDDDAWSGLIAALGEVKGAPGRLQLIHGAPSGAAVFVDYAHTPDALAHVLEALRPHADGALMVVFGCGGDRDPGKRPIMGKIAADLADKVFITDDNPRSEEPGSIRFAVREACPGAVEVGDREEAIHLAVSKLGVGDILVVAGKGHETGQIIGSSVHPFDDAAVVKVALNDLTGRDPKDQESLQYGNGR